MGVLRSTTQKNWRAFSISIILLLLFVLGACQESSPADATQEAIETANEHASHASSQGEHRAETTQPSPVELDPSRGQAIGIVYEAFLSPHQEGEDEEDTPSLAPDVFKSTAPSVPRNERTSRGHGTIAFTKDLSKAYVHVAIENVNPDDIVMFHIHCGRPGQLGPIIVDFGLMGDFQTYFEDGVFAAEVTNDDIRATTDHGHGIVGAFTAGCPIVPTMPLDKVKTIAGMQFIGEQGELYFNLHTKGQTFFGDIRGQLARISD